MSEFGKWIPCSERMPEKYGNYLVWNSPTKTALICSYDVLPKRCKADLMRAIVESCNNSNAGIAVELIKKLDAPYWGAGGPDINITAWMELPEPFEK